MIKAIGGLSLGSFLPVSAKNLYSDSPNKTKQIETDILVVGGGTAGVVAAIQAARAGCSTILVENGSQLGGTMTTGGVAFPGLFYAWGKQIISGIGWELVKETVEMNDGILPDFSVPTGKNHSKHQVSINKNLYAMLSEDKCLEAGVKIRYYETPVKINFHNNNWEVDLVGKGNKTKIICNQLIDCTGNALMASMANFQVLKANNTQPGSLMFKLSGYDPKSLDYNTLQKEYSKELKKGGLDEKEFFGNIERLLRQSHISSPETVFVQHIAGADSTTSETHTRANLRGRASLFKMLKFLRELPGCENIHVHDMSQETGIRESYRIKGEYQISGDDYVSGKIFSDSVAWSFYPIDIHGEEGVEPKHLKEGVVPTIPLRALIPEKSKNFLVAGRCISSDHIANSAIRVQASCMAMGQAAAAAAVLANRKNKTPLDIPVDEIHELIIKHGGIVPTLNV